VLLPPARYSGTTYTVIRVPWMQGFRVARQGSARSALFSSCFVASAGPARVERGPSAARAATFGSGRIDINYSWRLAEGIVVDQPVLFRVESHSVLALRGCACFRLPSSVLRLE
jgi:hypothetical protein